jgi:hypothetical protein
VQKNICVAITSREKCKSAANVASDYAEKEVPQPQVALALGLMNLKPPP